MISIFTWSSNGLISYKFWLSIAGIFILSLGGIPSGYASIRMVMDTVPTQSFEDMPLYKVADDGPLFGSCEERACNLQELSIYIQENLQYPEEASSSGVGGKVFVQFIVEPDGFLSHIKVVRDIGVGYGDAARELIQSMNGLNLWRPATLKGKPVRIVQTIPVFFDPKGK